MSKRPTVQTHIVELIGALLLAVSGQMPAFAQLTAQDGSLLPTLMYDREFAADPSLTAQANQGIVFTQDQPDSLGRFTLPGGVHRFCLKGGAGYYTSIRLETSKGHRIFRPLDQNGCIQAQVPQGIVCVRLGHRPWPSPVAGTTAIVRISGLVAASPSPPPVPLVDSQNSPVGGYWAIQDLTFNARGTFGNRILTTTPNKDSQLLIDPSTAFDGLSLLQFPPISGENLPALPLNTTNRWSLFFEQPYVVDACGDYCGNAYGPPPLLQIKDLGNYEFAFGIDPPQNLGMYGDTSSQPTQLRVTLGGVPADTFQVLFRFFPDGTQIGTLNVGEVAIYQACNQQGRAAVFIPLEGAGVVSGSYDLAALSSSLTTLNGTGKAVQIGKGSSIYWGPSASNPQGAVASNTSCLPASPAGQLFVEPVSNTLVVAHDLLNKSCVDCVLNGQSLNLPAGSPATDFSGWNFSGADFSNSVLTNLNLSGANLSGAKFIGATITDVILSGSQVSSNGLDFTGATLTRVKFDGVEISNFNFSNATLSNIDLSKAQFPGGELTFTGATMNQVNLSGLNPAALTAAGAKLCGVSLVGSGPDNLVDLTSGNFNNVSVTISSSCVANLSYTKLAANVVPGSPWTGFNFTGTVITGLPPGQVLSTQTNPLDLSGVQITGVSLQGVVLDHAQGLAGRDLTGVQLNNSSLRHVNLSGAKLYGAKLGNANLEGANMGGADLEESPDHKFSAANLSGAFLRNANLFQSQLSGAIFTNANFYSQTAVGQGVCTPDPNTGFTTACATAAGSTMDGTVFNSAYLFGVDFTKTTAQGVDFGNAILTGANFNGATLTASTSGADSGFAGAFLQGTNMAGLTLPNGISLQSAFVDFTPAGNVLTLTLNNFHTTFADYWNTPGEPVCAQMTYNGRTTIPATNGQVTCPDGHQYTNGCGTAAADGSNGRWKSPVDITTQASYLNNATYTNAPASGNPICTADILWVPLALEEPHPVRHRPSPHPIKRPKPKPTTTLP